jgi:hypothetical protein
VAVQSLLLTSSIPNYLQKSPLILSEVDTPEFIMVGGWMLLKSDLLDPES